MSANMAQIDDATAAEISERVSEVNDVLSVDVDGGRVTVSGMDSEDLTVEDEDELIGLLEMDYGLSFYDTDYAKMHFVAE